MSPRYLLLPSPPSLTSDLPLCLLLPWDSNLEITIMSELPNCGLNWKPGLDLAFSSVDWQAAQTIICWFGYDGTLCIATLRAHGSDRGWLPGLGVAWKPRHSLLEGLAVEAKTFVPDTMVCYVGRFLWVWERIISRESLPAFWSAASQIQGYCVRKNKAGSALLPCLKFGSATVIINVIYGHLKYCLVLVEVSTHNTINGRLT